MWRHMFEWELVKSWSNIKITYFWVGANVVSRINMCMVYIWVGVYNILDEWNGDFINVVNIVMDQWITYEVSLNVKYPWRWMYLWWIDMFDKYFVRSFSLSKVFWRSSKWSKRRKVHLLVRNRLNVELITQYNNNGWRICWYELFIV